MRLKYLREEVVFSTICCLSCLFVVDLAHHTNFLVIRAMVVFGYRSSSSAANLSSGTSSLLWIEVASRAFRLTIGLFFWLSVSELRQSRLAQTDEVPTRASFMMSGVGVTLDRANGLFFVTRLTKMATSLG